MIKLNLPTFELDLKQDDGRTFIYDALRKRHVVLTPEEWVRQHFIHYLVDQLKYPKALIRVEGGLRFNKLQKRSDIVVFDRLGKPWMVIECKAPDLKLNERAVLQASTYNYTLRAKYLVVTNGMMHVCCHIDWANRHTVIVAALPEYS